MAAPAVPAEPSSAGFSVSLDVYEGPFDALLGMIAARRLELTELSLSAITEEFLAYVRGMDLERDLGEASEFLDVASVLVEAKSVALLPDAGDGGRDDRDLEALRERDLLFARLLQYRAFRAAADDLRARLEAGSVRHPHPGTMDAAVAALLPDLVWTLGADDLARIAARAFADAPASEVSVRQLHVPPVDLRAQSALVRRRLEALGVGGTTTFAELTADASERIVVVARFLAVLALFKQGAVRFRQDGPYDTLYLRWEGGDVETRIDERDFA